MAIVPPASADTRDFALRFGENARGNITFAGNTLVRCPVTDVDTCLSGAVHNNPTPNNNGRRVGRLDVDGNVDLNGDGTDDTETSSRAVLSLPPGAEVLFAGLYWAGNVRPDYSESDSDDTDAWRNTFIDTPGPGGYETVTGTELDTVGPYGTAPSIGHEWNSFVDVTDIVQAGGTGEYTVAGVPIHPNTTFTNGVSSFGGWAIWVAYEHPDEPWRNLSVFDGYQSPTQDFDVTGFLTPPTGSFNTAVGVSSVEGDGGTTGDSMRINDISLTDTLTSSSNFFNSRITRFGVDDGDRTPNFLNQLGWDTKLVDADAVNPNIVPNGATSAEVTITSSGDQYSANAIATAIDIFSPDLSVTKEVENVDQPDEPAAFAGDELEYTLIVENATGTASDTAADVVLRDAIPQGTTYVPGSLEMVSGDPAPSGGRTDDAADDSAEFDGTEDEVVFRLGEGADATDGGEMDPGESATLSFRVTIDDDFPAGESVFNDAAVDFTGDATGEELDVTSNVVETPVIGRVTDLSLEKTGDALVDPEGPVTWTLTATNHGPDDSTGSTATDTVPDGFTNIAAPGCDVTGNEISCDVGPLGLNDTQTFTITANAPDATSTCFDNDASVESAETDLEDSNNSDSVRTCTTPAADLELEKTGDAVVDPNGEVSWTLTVTNNGPDSSSGSTITDTVPAEVTNVAAPGCDVTGNEVSCDVGPLGPNEFETFEVTGTAPATTSTCFENLAAVEGEEADPIADNDDATARSCTPAAADLELTKSAPATVDPEGLMSWTLTVHNNGPNPSTGSTVTDELPAQVTNVSAPGCDVSGQTITCEVGPLAVDGETEITITGNAPETPSFCFSNAALVVGDEGDPVSENDDDAARTCTTPAADLELEKTATAVVDPEGEVTWELTVTNHGPDPSTGGTVTDHLPAQITNISAPDCDVVSHTITCEVDPLAVDGTQTFTITGNAPDLPSFCFENQASVAGAEGDPVTENNDAGARTCTTPSADLQLEKSAPATVERGGQVTWTLTVTNLGPNESSGSTVTDTLPPSITDVASSDCEVDGQTVSCAVGPLDVDGTASFEVTGTAPETSATCFDNDGSVAGIEGDPVLANNSDSVETCTQPAADLELVKSAPATVAPNGQVTWTLTVTNNGPDASPSATVSDTLPVEISNVATETPGCTVLDNAVECALGPMPAAGTAEITITGDAPATFSTCFDNAASVLGTEDDLELVNNTDSVETCTTPAPPSGKPKLKVNKQASDDEARPGEVISYRIVVRNKGKADARRVKVCDKLPNGLKVLSAPGADTQSKKKVCWKLKALKAGGKRKFKVVAQIALNAKAGGMKNKAIVKAANGRGSRDAAEVDVEPVGGPCPSFGAKLRRC